MNNQRRAKLSRFLVALFLVLAQGNSMYAVEGRSHTLSGIIYFTNNIPRNLASFPVELYTRNQSTRLIAGTANANGTFRLTGIKPGKYLLKLTWPERCTLWYRVEVPGDSSKRIRVIMDAACSKHDGLIQDVDTN